jgi:hypothetical protein
MSFDRPVASGGPLSIWCSLERLLSTRLSGVESQLDQSASEIPVVIIGIEGCSEAAKKSTKVSRKNYKPIPKKRHFMNEFLLFALIMIYVAIRY